MPGLYLHIPFCASRCIYCDFYSRTGLDRGPCLARMEEELEERAAFLKGVPPTTMYIGGGTPSLLTIEELSRLVSKAFDVFGVTPGPSGSLEEFTIEVNPDDVTPEKAAAWLALGAGRISMGVQSLSDDHLKWMHRRHTAADAVRAYDTLREAGCGNVSIDLIFGFTGLSDDNWEKDAEAAIALHPDHISCYQMTGRYADPDQERCRGQYALLQERLADAGYLQYEISNYSLPGRHSRHNSAYWTREAYLGIGASAHSFDGDRLRCWNCPDIASYSQGLPGGEERLSNREVYEEKLMLSLRTVAGLSLSRLTPLERTWLSQKEPVLERLSGTGKLICDSEGIRIPAGELFVSDGIIASLFPL